MNAQLFYEIGGELLGIIIFFASILITSAAWDALKETK